MTEDEIKRLTEAFSRLTGDTDELSEQLKKNLAQQDVYTVAVKKSNDAIDKEILSRLKSDASLVRGQQVYEQQMRALGLAKNALGEFERATVTLTSTQKKRLADEELIANRQKARDDMSAKYHTMMADKTGTLIKGLEAFGSGLEKTVFDSTRGQSKYGELMNDFGSGIQSATSNLGPFGKALGFAASGLFKLVGAAFKQQEVLNKSYETLSEIGALDVTGIDGMFKALQNTGFTVTEIDKFTNIIKTAGSNLATMGTSVADGTNKFAASMKAARESGAEKQLRMLGFTSETLAKTFVDYQGMMSRTGMIQERDGRKVSRESVEYAKTLDQLTKLTGATRDEMQKRADADANDLKYRLQLQDLQKQDVNLYKQVRNTTLLAAEMGEETVGGLREMIAGGGQVIGDASAKLSLATNGAAEAITQDLLAGKITAVEANQKLALAINSNVENYREQFKLSNDISAALGISAKQIDGANKLQSKGQAELEQIIKDQQAQEEGELDDQRRAEVARQITERNLEQGKDRLNNIVGKSLVESFEKLQIVINGFAKKIAEYLAKFGGPDFTDLFLTQEEIASKLEASSTELSEVNQRMVQINKAEDVRVEKQQELENKDLEIEKLQQEYRKANNKEEKTELNERIKTEQKNRAVLQAEFRQAAQDKAKGKSELPKLQEKKTQLEADVKKQEQRYASVTGVETSAPTGPTKPEPSPEAKQSSKQQEFYDKLYATLLDQAKKQNVANPEAIARLGAAQSAVETGYGKSLAGGNNYFGIKAKPGDIGAGQVATQEWDDKQKKFITIQSRFRKYASMEQSAADYIKFLKENKRYKNVLAAKTVDEAIAEQGKTGYATDPKYFAKIAAVNSSLSAPKPTNATPALKAETKVAGAKPKPMAETVPGPKQTNATPASKPTEAVPAPKPIPESSEVPKAQTGGLFSGPKSGYPVLLHGTELIIPMPNVGDLATMLSSVTKTPLNEAAPAASAPSTTITVTGMDQFMALQNDLMNMMATKLDALESRMAKGNDIQENILTYSMG
jgi:flagellum-specific peptidoglycan hydrolase FlgJ